MRTSFLLKGVFLYLLVSLGESVGFLSAKWPAPANKVPIELDLSLKESTSDYVYSLEDNSNVYIAVNNIVFKSLISGDKLMWSARDHTEYATQVVFSPNYWLTLLLLDGNLKHFKFVNSLMVEVGLNEIPSNLNIDFRSSSYDCEYVPISNGHLFQAKSYYKFSSVNAGDRVLFKAQTPEECVYLVSITGNKFMTMLLLNGEIKKFELLDHGWTMFNANVELPKISEGVPSEDFTNEIREKFMEGFKTYFSRTFKDCPNLALENWKLRSELKHLDDELSVLKQDYDQFRSRVSSLDNSIERVAESVFLQ